MDRLIFLGILLYCVFEEAAALYKYKYFGCYTDNPASPQLNGKEVTLTTMNIKDCAVGCNSAGFPYCGILAGSRCLCGNEYGAPGALPRTECNYTCPVETASTTTQSCGGVGTTSIFYASDSDPKTRVDRVFLVYPQTLSWIDARHACVKKDGDLVVLAGYAEVNMVKSMVNTTAGISGSKVWVGLFQMNHLKNVDFTWTDQTSYHLDYTAGYLDPGSNPFDTSLTCMYLNTATFKLTPADCSTTLPYVCKQLPNVEATTATNGDANGDDTASDGELTEDEKKRNRIMLYVLLPVFIICYGGSCLVYVIGKIWKSMHMKRKKLQMQAAFEPDEYEPDTKPIMGGSMQKQGPPPAYYAGETAEKLGGRQRWYQHEREPTQTKEDEIDFTKLQIQDIIYIKSLMGERHAPPDGKKRKILVA